MRYIVNIPIYDSNVRCVVESTGEIIVRLTTQWRRPSTTVYATPQTGHRYLAYLQDYRALQYSE